jgi:hypothetical protein
MDETQAIVKQDAELQRVGADDLPLPIARIRAIFDSGLLPKSVKSWQQAMTIVLMGKELGIGPMTALRSIYVVDGKPTMSAELMVAMVRGKGMGTFSYEQTDGRCTVTGKRFGSEETYATTWDRKRAARAGLDRKENWLKYETEMLRHRAEAEVCRALFGDVLANVYLVEELEEGRIETRPEPASRTAAIKQVLGLPAELPGVPERGEQSVPEPEVLDGAGPAEPAILTEPPAPEPPSPEAEERKTLITALETQESAHPNRFADLLRFLDMTKAELFAADVTVLAEALQEMEG